MELKYKRILLKLSGEALAGEKKIGLDYTVIRKICEGIQKCADAGVQIGIVVGGGNFLRGRMSEGLDRTRADYMGMLATTINAMAIADVLESLGVEVRVQTAIAMQQIAEPYSCNKALSHLKKGRVVIFGCGTGNPYFSTDTAAALRGIETKAEVMLKATLVDGVYDKDPHKFEDAKRYDTLSFSQVLNQELAVMDMAAATMCRDYKLPMLVFDLSRPDNILDAVLGKSVGTIITEET
ncbi:MAG: UMP kinase [Oscillospiraceae bacterium]|nr:UMP kinase [Oscillospiraceae bacterium]